MTIKAPRRVEPPQPETALVPAPSGVERTPRMWAGHRRGSWVAAYRAGLFVIDLMSCAIAGFLAIRLWPQKAQSGFLSEELLVWIAVFVSPLAWTILLWMHGAYDGRYLGLGSDEFKRVFKALTTMTALVCFLAFTLKAPLSRLAVATVLPSTLLITIMARYLARKFLHALRKRGVALQRILLVGTLGETLSVYRIATRNPFAGLVPVGICLTEPTREQPALPIPVTNGQVNVIDRVADLDADAIAVCGSQGMDSDALRRMAWQIEGTGIDLIVAPSLTNIAGPRIHIRPVEGLPLLHVEEPTISGVGWFVKGVLDRVVATLSLVLLSPIFGLLALLIKGSSPGPIFFRQERMGRGGETFQVWKFRTMYVDAEERLAGLLGQNETDGLLFKMRDDPRITPIGRWMRRLSLDELPQLFNVLTGEMSMVGPRPLVAQDSEFIGDVRRRLLVRPGITGLWQVSGRSNLSWEDAVRLDLYYVDNWSLMFDFMIMWKTVFVVLKRDGAY